ncbi:hypothetical protein [Pseudomonas sp. RIT-PI-AD]|uniref:hypothetical protein n=1 Tax=Pseudomonas sp. RIT-PI-AD TaxID=3035294 RepID=UPI0021D8A9B2|nr:hypothetical protein [Pseudomonas sp. RIT-PI-AD]
MDLAVAEISLMWVAPPWILAIWRLISSATRCCSSAAVAIGLFMSLITVTASWMPADASRTSPVSRTDASDCARLCCISPAACRALLVGLPSKASISAVDSAVRWASAHLVGHHREAAAPVADAGPAQPAGTTASLSAAVVFAGESLRNT